MMDAVPVFLFFIFHRKLLMCSFSNIFISQIQDQQTLRRLGNGEAGTQTPLPLTHICIVQPLLCTLSCALATTFSYLEVSGMFQWLPISFLNRCLLWFVSSVFPYKSMWWRMECYPEGLLGGGGGTTRRLGLGKGRADHWGVLEGTLGVSIFCSLLLSVATMKWAA